MFTSFVDNCVDEISYVLSYLQFLHHNIMKVCLVIFVLSCFVILGNTRNYLWAAVVRE